MVRRRLEEEPECGIKKRLLKKNWIQVFEDKTAALIKHLQLSSCEKAEGGNQLPGQGVGDRKIYYSCLVSEKLEDWLCCGLDDTYMYLYIYLKT